MMPRFALLVAGAAGALGLAVPAGALEIDSVDRGWIDFLGEHNPARTNTFTGRTGFFAQCDPDFEREPVNCVESSRTFLAFDVPSDLGTVTGARLEVTLEAYLSEDAEESFTLYDVGSDPTLFDVLRPRPDTGGMALFADLGTGAVYGAATARPDLEGTLLSIPLSADALADIRTARGGRFLIGVSLDRPTDTIAFGEGIRFNRGLGNDDPLQRLVLSVPEPALPALLALLAAIAFASARRPR